MFHDLGVSLLAQPSLTKGHLSSFQFLVIMNKTAMDIALEKAKRPKKKKKKKPAMDIYVPIPAWK